MAAPSTALTVQRSDLAAAFEEFDVMANARDFIAPRVLSPIAVARQAGQCRGQF